MKPMAKTVEYQGYTIQSAPHHLANGEKLQLRIFISVDDHRGVRTREFSADVLYATEQEADIHGIATSMPFTLRLYQRFPVHCPVTSNAGPFHCLPRAYSG